MTVRIPPWLCGPYIVTFSRPKDLFLLGDNQHDNLYFLFSDARLHIKNLGFVDV